MDAKTFFSRCLPQTSSVVDQVKQDDFTKPTPCTDWNVEQLAAHMLYELSWVPPMVEGKTIAEVGDKYDGDLIKPSLGQAWYKAAELADRAVAEADLKSDVHLSFGDHSSEYYIWQIGGEMLIHGWDLAEGIGKSIEFEEPLVREFYKRVKPQAASFSSSGLFATPVKADDGADLQTKLLGLFGRKPNWTN